MKFLQDLRDQSSPDRDEIPHTSEDDIAMKIVDNEAHQSFIKMRVLCPRLSNLLHLLVRQASHWWQWLETMCCRGGHRPSCVL